MSLIITRRGYTKLEVVGDHLIAHSAEKTDNYSLIGIYRIDCSRNHFHSLPELPDSIEILLCFQNELKTLSKLPRGLKELYCDRNDLENIPELPESLIGLDCSRNKIRYLPKLPKNVALVLSSNNPIEFISSLPFEVDLNSAQSIQNYQAYSDKYSTYKYLISFLILESNVLPPMVLNELWWFPGVLY